MVRQFTGNVFMRIDQNLNFKQFVLRLDILDNYDFEKAKKGPYQVDKVPKKRNF